MSDQLSPFFILQSFTDFIEVSTTNHPERENILLTLKNFSQFWERHNYSIQIANDYLRNLDYYTPVVYSLIEITQKPQSLKNSNEVLLKPLPAFLIQRLQTERTDMVCTGKSCSGLCKSFMVGLLLTNSSFTEANSYFRDMNDQLAKLKAKSTSTSSPEHLIKLFNSENHMQTTDTFYRLSQALLRNNNVNTQLVDFLSQNGIQNDQELDSQDYSITQAISLLYVLQSYIPVDIQSILLIKPNTSEQRIISFNSSNIQIKNSITFLLEIADSNCKNVEYNIIIPRSKGIENPLFQDTEMQEAMKNGSSRELKELQSRKMIKEIIDELGKNTEELRQAYSLASLDNNYQKDFLQKQLKSKLQNTRVKETKSEIQTRQNQFQTRRDEGGYSNNYNSNNRSRSRSPVSIRSRECMRCKKVFQIDMFNIGSQISHFCNECKSTFLKK